MLTVISKALFVATKTNDWQAPADVAPFTPGRVLPRLSVSRDDAK